MSTRAFATSSTMVESSILNISVKEQARTSHYCDTERDAAFRHTTSEYLFIHAGLKSGLTRELCHNAPACEFGQLEQRLLDVLGDLRVEDDEACFARASIFSTLLVRLDRDSSSVLARSRSRPSRQAEASLSPARAARPLHTSIAPEFSVAAAGAVDVQRPPRTCRGHRARPGVRVSHPRRYNGQVPAGCVGECPASSHSLHIR
jgi:hypothetical protein